MSSPIDCERNLELVSVCPFCHGTPKLVTGKDVYRITERILHVANKMFWKCESCGSFVGCHPPSSMTQGRNDIPLGTLADAALRKARKLAHAALDAKWTSGGYSRSGTYARLARDLGIHPHDCHIAQFDTKMCNRVVQTVNNWEEI